VPRPLLIALIVLAALSIALALRSFISGRRSKRRQARMRDDLGAMQAALLPEIPERLGPLSISVAYRPAEGPAAGGDFYDAFAMLDGRIAVVIGDVSGHGAEALARTASIHYALRAWLKEGLEPREVLARAGRVLSDDLDEDFATVIVARFDPADSTLTWAAAGHHPPLLQGAVAEPLTVPASALLGFGLETGSRQTTLTMPPGSLACLYTDGLIEARRKDRWLGEEGLAQLLAEGSQDTGSGLLDRVRKHVDHAPDDMAVCLLRVHGREPAERVWREELVLAPEDPIDRASQLLRDAGLSDSEIDAARDELAEGRARHGRVLLKVWPFSRRVTVEPELSLASSPAEQPAAPATA
jgi:serine phosphatase RsbU (regulator of sigma subunit)